ncbi:MAG: hypothetical protein GY953_32710, partial [bacterium]|nr:hypothetical protein [bacterium]
MGYLGRICFAALLVLPSYPQTELFQPVAWAAGDGEQFRGAALGTSGTLYTWGDRLLRWDIREGAPAALVGGGPGFGAGGCLLDVDTDGREDVVLLENSADGGLGKLVWFRAPDWERRVIDTGAEFRDCASATFGGRRGILLIHRFGQVRFYEAPVNIAEPWPYRELYSIYTPSKQGGLLLADVDEDGHTDILCGNYWLRNPGEEGTHWRLFAINLWSETPESALSSLVLESITGGDFPDLLAAQADMAEARLALFTRPGDATQIWPQRRLEGMLGLRYPSAVAAGDLDADSTADLVVGENNGPRSRLLLFCQQESGRFSPSMVAYTPGLLKAWITDVDGDG